MVLHLPVNDPFSPHVFPFTASQPTQPFESPGEKKMDITTALTAEAVATLADPERSHNDAMRHMRAIAGFSEQDIANIRLQFHTHSAGDYLDQDFDDQEDCACNH